MNNYDVIIVGGGITGAGTARDCALRGLKTLLVERFDIADGASGRNHGLLHSGARYAVNDAESARECIKENMIIRRIAPHCVEEDGGLFITLPEDSLEYQAKFVECCRAAGIDAEVLTPEEAIKLEPAVNPTLIGAVKVPDASVDPFRLTAMNVLDAKLHGADVLTYHEVVSLIREDGRVVGVKMLDHANGDAEVEARAKLVVNAAGIWGQKIAEMAGAVITMFPAKGALLIFGHRVNHLVINRCRKPANADILVPGDVVCVIGTTSDKVPFEECDNMKVTPEEVKVLLEEGAKLAPSLATTRIIRAYAGVRPLVAAEGDTTGRNLSRGIVLLDHETRDNIPGFISITGGKLTSYRLMGEMAADLCCAKLGVDAKCRTAELPLPGGEKKDFIPGSVSMGLKGAYNRQGGFASRIDGSEELVCECEHVTRGEIEYAVKELGVRSLLDLRRRTRVGMGTCQGSFCMRKAAQALADALGTPDRAQALVDEYVAERWKGIIPVGWGDTLREAEYMRRLYSK